MFTLTNQVAIVTGGASGVGLEISRMFAKRGAIVHIFEINLDKAEREADLIIANGGQAYCHQVDVTDQTQVRRKMEKIHAHQPINILVNNARTTHVGTIEQTTEEDLDRLYEVNIKGVYNCIHCAIPLMIQAGGGCILNIASITASVGVGQRFAYAMSKGAVHAMTMQVAKDYAQDGIRCNSISASRVHTPYVDKMLKKEHEGREEEVLAKLNSRQPIGRMVKPEEVGAMAVYLASNEAASITGNDYLIDGGVVRLSGR